MVVDRKSFLLSFFLYILPGARFRALSAGVHCTLRVAGWKPTSNHIEITVGFFNMHRGWLSLHRGHPVNVPIRRTMHLSSVIPIIITLLSCYFWCSTGDSIGPSGGSHFFFIRRLGPSIYCYQKNEKKNQEYQAPQKYIWYFCNLKKYPDSVYLEDFYCAKKFCYETVWVISVLLVTPAILLT